MTSLEQKQFQNDAIQPKLWKVQISGKKLPTTGDEIWQQPALRKCTNSFVHAPSFLMWSEKVQVCFNTGRFAASSVQLIQFLSQFLPGRYWSDVCKRNWIEKLQILRRFLTTTVIGNSLASYGRVSIFFVIFLLQIVSLPEIRNCKFSAIKQFLSFELEWQWRRFVPLPTLYSPLPPLSYQPGTTSGWGGTLSFFIDLEGTNTCSK